VKYKSSVERRNNTYLHPIYGLRGTDGHGAHHAGEMTWSGGYFWGKMGGSSFSAACGKGLLSASEEQLQVQPADVGGVHIIARVNFSNTAHIHR
jgi:hypothetical protein